MLDKSFIGHEFPSFTTDVEKGRLRFFAKAIGGDQPHLHRRVRGKWKRATGRLPAPPTIPFVSRYGRTGTVAGGGRIESRYSPRPARQPGVRIPRADLCG